MADLPRMFAIALRQGPWVASVCWGTCGNGLMGGIVLGDGMGEAIPCVTPADACPHFVKEQDGEPFAVVEHPAFGDGNEPRPIWLRKISEVRRG